ncbi:type III-B CRISPR-associated protein Cas10/Cmr2 [Tolypothrix sp. VBCCA 56010]|uniref:type III-B CRISPR-associated protein Cas10/Cmr2 n=1 Tax=Tolypothrix sp. VBCCA 56010 TaxID=3137731 RepID=UPI003D7C9413
MNVYHRKLYALLLCSNSVDQAYTICKTLKCLQANTDALRKWWCIESNKLGELAADISSSSDRVNLPINPISAGDKIEIRHPISGQPKEIDATSNINLIASIPKHVIEDTDVEKVFWWFWRFYPELLASKQHDALLFPAHRVIPDTPMHSYASTVSAVVGAMFPNEWESEKPQTPYLLLFTFSPVQEFIKSSRKFLDFWAGSYLLHYLSAKLCWYIAEKYGCDAVITPSLWGQEIIDALIVKYKIKDDFQSTLIRPDPVKLFETSGSTSLSTAGFPNIITALVPGEVAAKALAKELKLQLQKEWQNIAAGVREDIKNRVIKWLQKSNNIEKNSEFLIENPECDRRDLEKWLQGGCWEWNQLWNAQINNTWESYWTALPLGNPEQELVISNSADSDLKKWKQAQEVVAPSRFQETPLPAEENLYKELNVGTWWGNAQSRLGRVIQAVKNTRNWQLPASPGVRSTLSGQLSAVHPQLSYKEQFREGAGLTSASMRLFWRLMSLVYKNLFNGSEQLNAIELTKRMGWVYGGVATSLGISISDNEEIDYEKLIRFPNLSSIASAKFTFDNLPTVRNYWNNLNILMQSEFGKEFEHLTRRPFNIYNTDICMNSDKLNGVMFSAKWLADDMNLQGEKVSTLRKIVDQAHKESGFADGSPSDWWVIVLADGDGMGDYVSGKKLGKYNEYIIDSAIDKTQLDSENLQELYAATKRMGPATHVGLNRALLDFSNRLVPYLTEKRFCGKVVYSGGDDVMAVLPLEDLPEYLLSLRAAWCGQADPCDEFAAGDGYWTPKKPIEGIPNRSLFTMGENATMSVGIVIAYKSVPLPTVLENIWQAEKERAKKLPKKDGLCFRVIYGGGNTLEAVMKGKLLEDWYKFIQSPSEELSPLLFRLAEELPLRASVTENHQLFSKVADTIMSRRDESKKLENFAEISNFLNAWEEWVKELKPEDLSWEKWNEKLEKKEYLGTHPDDLGNILRFSAFWASKMVQRQNWRSTSQVLEVPV